MRRSVVLQTGLFEQTLRAVHGCEDWDLWLRIAPQHDFVGSSVLLVRYRLHGDTFSAKPNGMQTAVRAVIEKHFGPDDGHWPSWCGEKRRAYGGVYRYHLLNSVRRKNDWQAAVRHLRLALQIDPSLASDLDLFYELSFGSQPPGYHGSTAQLTLEDNALYIDKLLDEVFSSTMEPILGPLKRQTTGTAFYALGLVAYNSGKYTLSRQFLLKALYFRPDLWRNYQVSGSLMKSLLGPNGMAWMKRHRKQVYSAFKLADN